MSDADANLFTSDTSSGHELPDCGYLYLAGWRFICGNFGVREVSP